MAVLAPLPVTIKQEKGAALTHAEMDANMRLLKALVNDKPQIAIAAAFLPEHVSITGITAISSDMTDPSPALDAYLLDPLTITINSFFEPSVCDLITLYIETEGNLLANIQPSINGVFVLANLTTVHTALSGVVDAEPIILSFYPDDDDFEAFRMQIGTYTKVSGGGVY